MKANYKKQKQRGVVDISKYAAGKIYQILGGKQETMCDKCTHWFTVGKDTQVESHYDAELQVTVQYFRCPECKQHYIVLVSNSDTDALREILNKEQQNLEHIKRRLKEKVEHEVVVRNVSHAEASRRVAEFDEAVDKQTDTVHALKERLEGIHKALEERYPAHRLPE